MRNSLKIISHEVKVVVTILIYIPVEYVKIYNMTAIQFYLEIVLLTKIAFTFLYVVPSFSYEIL